MVKGCAMGSCKNRSDWIGNKENRFFKFPKDKNRRHQWASLCGRKNAETGQTWAPKDHVVSVFLCSKHFVSGQPSRKPHEIDYLPSLFLPTQTLTVSVMKQEKSVKRLERVTRRKLLTSPTSNCTSACEDELLMTDEELVNPLVPEQDLHSDIPILCDIPDPKHEPLQQDEIVVPNLDPADLSANEIQEESDSAKKDRHIANLEKKLASAEKEKALMKTKNEYLEAKMNTVKLSSATIYEDDHKSRLYTGLSWKVFLALFHLLAGCIPEAMKPTKISRIDQFFYVLVRLRHNDVYEKLADSAGVSKVTMIEYFWKWIDVLVEKCHFLIQWPDREYIYQTIPPHFRGRYPRLTCIIDCFELFIEKPSNLYARGQVYSTYKSHTTAKYLIGCNSLGAITFLSKGFGGRASDLQIVRESGFLNPHLHFPGDQILADRGFTFQQELSDVCGAELLIPSFIKGKEQFSTMEVESSRKIASVRIHIERVIGVLKNRFAILQQTIPLGLINSMRNECHASDYASLDKIVQACAMLINLDSGIVYRD